MNNYNDTEYEGKKGGNLLRQGSSMSDGTTHEDSTDYTSHNTDYTSDDDLIVASDVTPGLNSADQSISKTNTPKGKSLLTSMLGKKKTSGASSGKSLWSKLKSKSKFLTVNKVGRRNELYKIAVYGASQTGKTVLCSRVIGCTALSTSNSTDADDLQQHAQRHTLYDEQEHQVVVSDQLLEDDSIVTVLHHDHPSQTIGFELSNGQAVNIEGVDAARIKLRDNKHHNNTVQEDTSTRTTTETYIIQINEKKQPGLKDLKQLKTERYKEEDNSESDDIHDAHDEDGNYIGGHSKHTPVTNTIHRRPKKYGLQMIETPPCKISQVNKRGSRVTQNKASRVVYNTIESLGIFPNTRKVKSETEKKETKKQDPDQDGEKKPRSKKKAPRSFPEPGSRLVPTNESNLLWRRCVTGAAVVLYNITQEETFRVAKDMLSAIASQKDRARKVPVLLIANFSDLKHHDEYDFDRDCEIAHQNDAFFAYGSMVEDRLIYQGQAYTVLQLIHQLVYTMKTAGLLLHGPAHAKPLPNHGMKTKTLQDSKKSIDLHAMMANIKIKEEQELERLNENNNEEPSWFGWCSGGRK